MAYNKSSKRKSKYAIGAPKGKTPSRSCNLRKGVLFSAYGPSAIRQATCKRKGSVFVQPLSLTSFDSSPSRGASGETVHFAGTAKASPTRGGGSASALTERLYEDGPALGSSLANLPHRACLPSGISPQNAKPPRRSTSPGAFFCVNRPKICANGTCMGGGGGGVL